ncbi:beta-lactamase-like protein, partial [Protomyces lactucae-debilis]
MRLVTLGTSCAQQTTSRTQSAHLLALDAHTSYLVDCGSNTGFSLLKTDYKLSSIRKIFLTHLHADHCIGLPALLADLLGGHGGRAEDVAAGKLREGTGKRPLEIYGPLGTQEFLRTNFRLTYTALASPFRVIELLFDEEQAFEGPSFPREEGSCIKRPDTDSSPAPIWSSISSDHRITVDAVAIQHTVPTLGFIFREADFVEITQQTSSTLMAAFGNANAERRAALSALKAGQAVSLPTGSTVGPLPKERGRTVVLLGDTHDASGCLPHLERSVVSLVLHESTNAYLPPPYGKPSDTLVSVRERAASRGHSTPEVAGAFASACQAKMLVLTHFSSRYGGKGQ